MKNHNHQNKYHNILENMADGHFVVDKNHTITFWDRAVERILGYTAKEAVGKSCALLIIVLKLFFCSMMNTPCVNFSFSAGHSLLSDSNCQLHLSERFL
jgi:transcriptional regulator with PAS, ATPase and Fis domain